MLQYIIPAMKMLFTVENFIWINLGVFIGYVFAAIHGLTVILLESTVPADTAAVYLQF